MIDVFLKNSLYLFFSFFLFQNCAPFEPSKNGEVYSYKTMPDFFWDLKLISVNVDDSGRETFSFDLAVSYAKDPRQNVSYFVAYRSGKQDRACLSQSGQVNNQSNHIRLTDCTLAVAGTLEVKLTFVGIAGERVEEILRY